MNKDKKSLYKIDRKLIEIDAAGKPVGRLASVIASHLRGKTKATFQPHTDCGDMVKVINVSKIIFTGRKVVQKDLLHHSMHPGGLKRTSVEKLMKVNPTKVLEHAVNGMLPKNRTRVEMMKRLTLIA
ncbi:MAG TPA: 50S ribosomal protein L13 [Candidatus Magasanikbacteria bacterium]|nr:50S ribosomal protein L13 [Candidatus Magasanikbacteria bacterium]